MRSRDVPQSIDLVHSCLFPTQALSWREKAFSWSDKVELSCVSYVPVDGRVLHEYRSCLQHHHSTASIWLYRMAAYMTP